MSININALLLAAGLGTRLRPFTNDLPKCLMPIKGRPILDYWLEICHLLSVNKAIVNLHYLAPLVLSYLSRRSFENWVVPSFEKNLLGTAGAIRKNKSFLMESTTLLIHADNWCQCNFKNFLDFHLYEKPKSCLITMMTFESLNPKDCGIVVTNSKGIVTKFYEKQDNYNGNIANGAVYLIEPEVIDWIVKNPQITDFSTQVIPNYINKIAIWHNTHIHRDIGTIESLRAAQDDSFEEMMKSNTFTVDDEWTKLFKNHPIHNQINNKRKIF